MDWRPDLLFFFNDSYRLVAGERFDGSLDRSTAELLPFRDDTGAVAKVYCFPTETTEKVLAEQLRAAEHKRHAFRVELGDALRDASSLEVLRS